MLMRETQQVLLVQFQNMFSALHIKIPVKYNEKAKNFTIKCTFILVQF